MKKIYSFIFILILTNCFSEELPGKTDFTFKSTYPEGFGSVFQKIMVISKEGKNKNLDNAEDLYHVRIQESNVSPVLVRGFTPTVQKKLEALLASKESAVIKAIAYESIVSNGSPVLSSSAPDEGDFAIPAGHSWRAYKIINIMSFESLSK
jgi:hypothetical protein